MMNLGITTWLWPLPVWAVDLFERTTGRPCREPEWYGYTLVGCGGQVVFVDRLRGDIAGWSPVRKESQMEQWGRELWLACWMLGMTKAALGMLEDRHDWCDIKNALLDNVVELEADWLHSAKFST